METKEKISIALRGKKPQQKTFDACWDKKSLLWEVTSPSGDKIVIKSLSLFCKENNCK